MRSTNTGIPETLGNLLAVGADALTGVEAIEAANELVAKPNEANNANIILLLIILIPFLKIVLYFNIFHCIFRNLSTLKKSKACYIS